MNLDYSTKQVNGWGEAAMTGLKNIFLLMSKRGVFIVIFALFISGSHAAPSKSNFKRYASAYGTTPKPQGIAVDEHPDLRHFVLNTMKDNNLDFNGLERLINMKSGRNFKEELDTTEIGFKFRQICGDYYKIMEPLIIKAGGRFDIYDLGDSIIRRMTPIEKDFFYDTRRIGNCHLFPQYPVGKYSLDFGNPYHKIGVECDGKEFHDRDQDRERDKDIYLNHGWIIFRLGGDACYRDFENAYERVQEKVREEMRFEQDAKYRDVEIQFLKNYIEDYGEALIRTLRYAYFENNTWSKNLRADFEWERRERFGL